MSKAVTKKFSELKVGETFRVNGKDYRKIQPKGRLWDVARNALCLDNNEDVVIENDTVVWEIVLNEYGDLDYVMEEETPMRYLPYPTPKQETVTNWPKPITEQQLPVEDVHEDRNVE